MDNQHKKIKGYRDLSQAEIDLMNEIKELAEKVSEVVDKVHLVNAEFQCDIRWMSIGKTQLQQGFMALIRAVAQPTTF